MSKAHQSGYGFTRSWLFGAARYTTAGAVSIFELFGCAIYKRVGTVKQIAGITFGCNKVGE